MSTDAISAAAPKTQQTIEEFNAQLEAQYKLREQRTPSSELDQQGFLQVLVAQMMNQDPTSPMSNQDFASQVTSFSQLDATQKMQGQMSMLYSSSLIGKNVEIKTPTSKDPVVGTVTEVVLKDGAPNVIVAGTAYPLSQIQNIKSAPETVSNPNTPQLHSTTY